MGENRRGGGDLGGKTVAVDGVFAPEVVVEAVVEMDLMKLVTVAQRAPGYVEQLLGVVVDGEDDAVAGVAEDAADLVLVEVEGLEVRVEEEPVGLEVDRRLSPALIAQGPLRVDEAPERRARNPVVRPPLLPAYGFRLYAGIIIRRALR
jgi:hypothetical protein